MSIVSNRCRNWRASYSDVGKLNKGLKVTDECINSESAVLGLKHEVKTEYLRKCADQLKIFCLYLS